MFNTQHVDPDPANAWTKWVGLSTTILAVAAVLATLKDTSFTTQTQLATVLASNNWSYFNAKSLKQTARETEREIITTLAASALNEEAKTIALASIEKAKSEIVRYESEKAEIKHEAEIMDAKAKYYQNRGNYSSTTILFLQISIMLSAIAGLMKQKTFWMIGLAAGAIGAALLIFVWVLYPDFVPPDKKPPSAGVSKVIK